MPTLTLSDGTRISNPGPVEPVSAWVRCGADGTIEPVPNSEGWRAVKCSKCGRLLIEIDLFNEARFTQRVKM